MSKAAPISYPGDSLPVVEGAPELSALDRECRAFSYYLVGEMPNSYVLAKYSEACLTDAFARLQESQCDKFLLLVSSRHYLLARLVDCYTAVFFKKALVRKKWILLLAILENCAPTFRFFESPDVTGKWSFIARLSVKGALFLLNLCVASALFLPIQLGFGLHTRLFGRPV